MIETPGNLGNALGNATLEAAVETASHDLEITGITFLHGDLCQARYPTIIDYGRAPQGARFEPGVQILQAGHVLRFLFQIEEGQGVEILAGEDGLPVIQSVTDPYNPVAGLTAVLLNPLTCELTWDQGQANAAHGGFVKVTALRILCRLLDREPTNPEVVDGGLYLAIVNRPEEEVLDLGIGDAGDPEPHTIKLLGSDVFGRPVYDLFWPEAQALLPFHLGLEPTITIREHEVADVAVQIATLPGIDLRFEPAVANPHEVQVHGYEPRGWPPQLRSAEREPGGKRCELFWVEETGRNACMMGNPDQLNNYCLIGQINTFYLEAFLPDDGSSQRIPMQIDPTVIQPPSCTGGICI